PKIEKKRVVPLTVEQVGRLIDAAPQHYRPLIHFMAGTGTRAREAFGVTVDRIDWPRKVLTIDRQLATSAGGVGWKGPKTASSTRTLPLEEGVVQALARHLSVNPARVSGLIFTTPEGKAIDLKRVYGNKAKPGWFRKAARDAGLADEVTLHDLRHFFAS